jgi:hypothetical protein
MNDSQGSKSPIQITVDDQVLTFDDKHTDAASVLRKAGLDPTTYDLARFLGQGQTHVFRDDQPITLKTGDEFVTVHVSAPVA